MGREVDVIESGDEILVVLTPDKPLTPTVIHLSWDESVDLRRKLAEIVDAPSG
jgi:hypothetical protein